MWATIAFLLLAGTPVAAQDPLAAARELYASARYDEALAVLDGLRGGASTLDGRDRRLVEQYRSFCLIALGRAADADEAIASIVRADPSFLPSETDTSPRVLAAFREVRQGLLPDIALRAFAGAKQAYDAGEHVRAADEFRFVLALAGDPDMQGRANDLQTLASGFLTLAEQALAQAEAPPEPPAPVSDAIVDAEHPAVIPPVTERQDLPRLAGNQVRRFRGVAVLEVIVGVNGEVESASIVRSIHPSYDEALLAATREWRYRPALLDDAPVRFRKLIQIKLSGR